ADAGAPPDRVWPAVARWCRPEISPRGGQGGPGGPGVGRRVILLDRREDGGRADRGRGESSGRVQPAVAGGCHPQGSPRGRHWGAEVGRSAAAAVGPGVGRRVVLLDGGEGVAGDALSADGVKLAVTRGDHAHAGPSRGRWGAAGPGGSRRYVVSH